MNDTIRVWMILVFEIGFYCEYLVYLFIYFQKNRVIKYNSLKIYCRIHKFCLYMYVYIKIISLNNYLKIFARKNFFFFFRYCGTIEYNV